MLGGNVHCSLAGEKVDSHVSFPIGIGSIVRAKVYVTPKVGVLDPQGQTVERALHSLGYGNVQGVRIGKYVELDLDTSSPVEAQRQIREMCDRLLSNPVIEDCTFEIQD